MMNHKANRWAVGLCAVAMAGACLIAGCAGEEDKPVIQAAAPPPPPPPPPPPAVPSIEQLMADLHIDSRVSLPEDKAPATEADRKAVLVFFDAIARGNSQSLKGMLPLADQLELNALVESGAWKANTDQIHKISLQTGTNNLSQKCALAVIEVGAGANQSLQPQLWYFTTDQETPVFEAAPTPPGILDKLSGDWIAAWHNILGDEMAMADQPDEDLALAQRNLDTSADEKSSAESPGVGGGGGPSGGRKLRDPTGPPRKAPGL